jgi:hypothetical protein
MVSSLAEANSISLRGTILGSSSRLPTTHADTINTDLLAFLKG